MPKPPSGKVYVVVGSECPHCKYALENSYSFRALWRSHAERLSIDVEDELQLVTAFYLYLSERERLERIAEGGLRTVAGVKTPTVIVSMPEHIRVLPGLPPDMDETKIHVALSSLLYGTDVRLPLRPRKPEKERGEEEEEAKPKKKGRGGGRRR
ncbi:hypothetical protein [Thermofilum pendens]|uniref:Uncharacterized protein n=1 Tax=Thermofilum pendens (strain DSM 2475 / Hrk 5) TaxID=368408 RepID=A1S1F4_THEPD|nr:hypothetical protein [Thermofilum pendens]ABL79284.1 hypothetical protein Tpen_1889 [Thermofilum pendens Hrk 5]